MQEGKVTLVHSIGQYYQVNQWKVNLIILIAKCLDWFPDSLEVLDSKNNIAP